MAPERVDRKVVYTTKTVRFFLATIAFALITSLIAVIFTFAAYRDQHSQLVKLTQQNDCRSKVAADADAASYRSLVVLLDSVVAIAQRNPVDLAAIQKASADLAKAARAREAINETCSASNLSEGGGS